MSVEADLKRFEHEVENASKWAYTERHAFGRIRQALKSIPEDQVHGLVDEMISVSKVNGEYIEFSVLIDKYIEMLKPYETGYRQRINELTSDLMSNDCKYMQDEEYEIYPGKTMLNLARMKRAVELLTEAHDYIKEYEELEGKKLCNDSLNEIIDNLSFWKGVREREAIERETAKTLRQEVISLMHQLDELCSCNKNEYNLDDETNVGALKIKKNEISDKIALTIQINEMIKELPHTSVFGCLKHDSYSDLLNVYNKLKKLKEDYSLMDESEREWLKSIDPFAGKENLSFEEKARVLEEAYRDAFYHNDRLRDAELRRQRKVIDTVIIIAIVVVLIVALLIVYFNKKSNRKELVNDSRV